MKKTFIVIGLSDAQEPWLDPKALDAISKAKVFSGGKRHHEIMKGLLPNDYKWIDITVPLAKVFEQYRETFNSQFIVVFASGDPLFFGLPIPFCVRCPMLKYSYFHLSTLCKHWPIEY